MSEVFETKWTGSQQWVMIDMEEQRFLDGFIFKMDLPDFSYSESAGRYTFSHEGQSYQSSDIPSVLYLKTFLDAVSIFVSDDNSGGKKDFLV